MKRWYFLILIMFFGLTFGSESPKQCDKKEPRFFLNPGCSDGIAFEKYKNQPFVLFSKPSEKEEPSKMISEKDTPCGPVLDGFFVKKQAYRGTVISSTWKKGNFYKVCYKGKDFWVKGQSFMKIYETREYFDVIKDHLIFDIDSDLKLFEQVEGKAFSVTKLRNIVDPKKERYYLPANVTGYTEKNGYFWVKAFFSPSIMNNDEEEDKKTPVSFESFSLWFRPFNDDGQTSGTWGFPHKSISHSN